jgi:hypothetical protein
MINKVYKELVKAQNQCFKAGEDKLFDSCEYHLDILSEDLKKEDLKKIYIFAKDVYKIATLKNNLDPLV